MSHPPKRFLHLLAIWQERSASSAGPAVWRFSLEDARDGARRGFASLEELMAFLQAQVEGGEAQNVKRQT